MRILWLTIDRSNRIAHHFDDFRQTVSELSEVEVVTLKKPSESGGVSIWRQSRELISGQLDLGNILTSYLSRDPNFDFIFCDAFFAYINEDWESTNIPSAIFIEDVHQEVPKTQIQKAEEKGIKIIFHRFNFAFHKFHPEARFKFICIWLPHSIRMDRYMDTISKSIDVLHVGVCPEQFYPNRHSVVSQLRNKPYFKLIERPKDTPGESRTGKWPIDRDYDHLLQQSKITITGGSIFNAPVQKYVEIPAANSLLMSNWFPDLGLMGFVPGTNMISYFKEDVVEVVENTLRNEDELVRISNNGYNLILMNHTSEIRAKQFINNICEITKTPKIYKIEPCSFQINFNPNIENSLQIPNVSHIQEYNKTIHITGSDWKSRIRAEKARQAGYEVIGN